MDKKILLKVSGAGMGDALVSTPALKKLSKAYSKKIDLKSRHSYLFKNNPYIEKNLHLHDELDEKDYEVFECYESPNRKHLSCLCARSCAYDLGFDLLNEELTLEFYAENNTVYNLESLGNYICLHTTSNWPNRTWKAEYWQNLVNKLHDLSYNIVIIGKDYEEKFFDNSTCYKKCFVPIGSKVIDFTNDYSSVNDLWHLINKSKAIVTFDSGPIHLAGTTDTWIFQIGSARHPQFIAPFRNGSQDYKHVFIGGECDLFCSSDIAYSVKEWKTIRSTHFLPGCQENFTEFKCHPSDKQVYEKIFKNLS
jgi:ADP-heptose:LPS heptosyltransferase